MTAGTILPRLVAAGLVAALVLAFAVPATVFAASTDPELIATLELPAGDVDYDLELGTLHLFDKEDAPFAVYVFDGCSVDGNLWVFGAGLSAIPVPMTVLDLRSGKSARLVLPPFEPGSPIGTVLDPEALAVCGDDPVGGLPVLTGTATFTSADGRGVDYAEAIEVRSDGSERAYRRLVRSGTSYPIIGTGSPIVATDDSDAYDEILLLTEGRVPRKIEGVVFRGDQGMLPGSAKLEKALRGIDRSRVKRAFETAKNMRVPEGIVEELGLDGVEQVYHVSLDLETLGADAYLAQAGWIRDRGQPIQPPLPVDERFTVELVRADGDTETIPLVGPLVGSEAEGRLWEYRSSDALVQIIDACGLGGTFWTLAGAVTDEPLELIVTDTKSGNSASQLLWTDREEVSRLADGAFPADCP